MRGPDQTLWQLEEETPGGGWMEARDHGVGVHFANTPSPLELKLNVKGQLVLFFRGTDNALWIMWQETPGGYKWSDPKSLGGNLRSEPVVAQNADGRLEVFVTGADSNYYHIWQKTPDRISTDNWSSWKRLGNDFGETFANTTFSPVVAQNADGRLEVFARTYNAKLFEKEGVREYRLNNIWQKTPDSFTSLVDKWEENWQWFDERLGDRDLGGSDPVVIPNTNANGRLEIFMRKGNDVQHIWQETPSTIYLDQWSAWHNLGGGYH